MKVTDVPGQNGLADAEIATLTERIESTTITIVFEVAGLFDVQVIFEVSTHNTWSPFKGA